MSRTIHVCLSVRGTLRNWNPREWERCVTHNDGSRMTPEEFMDALLDHLSQGHEVIPFGQPCEGFDYKTGYPGHDNIESEARP